VVSDVRIEVDGETVTGRVVDLRDREVSVEAVRTALDRQSELPRGDAGPSSPPVVEPPPTAVGLWTVTADPPPLRRLLAAAARTRGETTPIDDRIRTLAAAVDQDGDVDGDAGDPEPSAPDLAAARKRVAEAGEVATRLRERVATLRGRLQARRDADGGVAEVQSELQAATRELTEAETERLAARQALDRARRRARGERDRRERRLRLRDELRNRRQEARDHLARSVYSTFADAARRLPGEASPGVDPTAFDGDRVTAHLAAVAVAAGDVPVIVAVDRFDDPRATADRLDAPVVRV
jgi:hypothetical protein